MPCADVQWRQKDSPHCSPVLLTLTAVLPSPSPLHPPVWVSAMVQEQVHAFVQL